MYIVFSPFEYRAYGSRNSACAVAVFCGTLWFVPCFYIFHSRVKLPEGTWFNSAGKNLSFSTFSEIIFQALRVFKLFQVSRLLTPQKPSKSSQRPSLNFLTIRPIQERNTANKALN